MRSELPKVLHPVLSRPMLHFSIDICQAVPHGSLAVVVGHKADEVKTACSSYPTLQFILQNEQLGTGHAVMSAKALLVNRSKTVLVLCGDAILLRPTTLHRLLESKTDAVAAAILTTQLSNPSGYGRIIRKDGSTVWAIREDADCTADERLISEINSGIYVFDTEKLYRALEGVGAQNAQKEFYLTDAIQQLTHWGESVVACEAHDPTEVLGINDRAELAAVESILRSRINRQWMVSGVSLEDPNNTFIDTQTRLSADVRIEGGCRLLASRIESGVVIESGCRIIRSTIGLGSVIRQGSYLNDCRVGEQAVVGPYAHLRPGSHLSDHVKIGNFVEIKNSTIGESSKASHLSYIGDASVGSGVNLGCGFITCNYDGGPQKHHTTIGNNVFVGSDSQTVAPVTLGDGSYVASGTTVTQDAPADSLVLSRGRQITKVGYARKFRKEV